MSAFWTAFVLVFVAELGDKTQFMTLAFASRFKPMTVMSGVIVATVLINLISVGLGQGAGKLLPVFWISMVAGIAFIVCGVWTLLGDLEEEEQEVEGRLGPFLTVVVAFFLAELGDKTMLTAIAVASKEQQFLPVWLGCTVGLVASNALAVLVGKGISNYFTGKKIKVTIAIVFIVSGVIAIWQAFHP